MSGGMLAVLIGPAGAGKSDLAAAVFGRSNVVSSDALRELACGSVWAQEQEDHDETFGLLHRVVAARCRRQLITAVDSSALRPDHRRPLLSYADSYGVPCVAVLVDTPLGECQRRNAGRERRVPDHVIAAHREQFDLARWSVQSEGFDAVITVDGTRSPDGAARWLAAQLTERAPA